MTTSTRKTVYIFSCFIQSCSNICALVMMHVSSHFNFHVSVTIVLATALVINTNPTRICLTARPHTRHHYTILHQAFNHQSITKQTEQQSIVAPYAFTTTSKQAKQSRHAVRHHTRQAKTLYEWLNQMGYIQQLDQDSYPGRCIKIKSNCRHETRASYLILHCCRMLNSFRHARLCLIICKNSISSLHSLYFRWCDSSLRLLPTMPWMRSDPEEQLTTFQD